MKQYIEDLKKQLQEVMERPASLGRAEEVTVYADAICALHKLGGDHFRESTKMMEFTEDDAKEWTARMENTDGTTGQHWPMEQTTAVMVSKGYHFDPAVWYAAMNMVYSDYFSVAKKHGINTVEFYADMAEAFLADKDAGGPEEKISAYYHCIAS
jgi:hypothetical protein